MPSYGRYNRRRRMLAVKSATKSNTPRRKNYNKKPKVSFAKKVNAVIARNVENKYSSTILYKEPVMTNLVSTDNQGAILSDAYTFFNWQPGSSAQAMTTIAQGAAVNQRIGNKIKIKRWIIKGLIQPNDAYNNVPSTTGTPAGGGQPAVQPVNGKLINSATGYIDIYLGKLTLNTAPIPNTLQSFFQSGNTDVTPVGNAQEQLYNINKDLYKIYYHKRFKMGYSITTSQVNQNSQYLAVQGTQSQSNDFGLTRSFGFDVTKYILKNHSLKFDEISTIALDANMENLTLFAIWHPAVGSVSRTTPVLGDVTVTSKSFYELNCMSYFEYEDA